MTPERDFQKELEDQREYHRKVLEKLNEIQISFARNEERLANALARIERLEMEHEKIATTVAATRISEDDIKTIRKFRSLEVVAFGIMLILQGILFLHGFGVLGKP